MPEKQFYDTIDSKWLTWRPLADSSSRVVARGLGDEGILQIGAFGTCGNPSKPGYASWRLDNLLPILGQHGLEDRVFNPEVIAWTPTRAPIESIHMARDEVVIVGVTNKTGSHAAIMEGGFAAYGGVLRGQDVIVSIENNDESPEETKVARQLALSVLSATEAQYPLFSLVDNLEILAHTAAIGLKERIRQRASGVDIKTEYTLPPIRTDLDPTIYLSGTSGEKKPAWMGKIQATAKRFGVSVDDSYRPDWDAAAADEELMHKLGNAVHLIAITSETESFGALSEIGPRVMYGDLAGQSIGVYIEDHGSAPNSPTNRTRTLAKAHLNRLHEDFPNLPVFVAGSLDELAIFGLSEYYRQLQRLR
ncbi:MAG: hypothetical protein ACOH18_01515 [Candidatus Saccharimonadaceae bacterium]